MNAGLSLHIRWRFAPSCDGALRHLIGGYPHDLGVLSSVNDPFHPQSRAPES